MVKRDSKDQMNSTEFDTHQLLENNINGSSNENLVNKKEKRKRRKSDLKIPEIILEDSKNNSRNESSENDEKIEKKKRKKQKAENGEITETPNNCKNESLVSEELEEVKIIKTEVAEKINHSKEISKDSEKNEKKLKRKRQSLTNDVDIKTENEVIEEHKVKVKKKQKTSEPIDHNTETEKGKQTREEESSNSALNEDAAKSGQKNQSNSHGEEASSLSIKMLRRQFSTSAGLDALRRFLVICKENKNQDAAAEYLRVGGSVLEVTKILVSSEKKEIGTATAVFSAVQILILKILEEFPFLQSCAEQACHHLLRTHLSSIHSMLSSDSSAKQRKTVLKLLTAMVSLGGTLPREILGHLSLHHEVLEYLVQHFNPTDNESVRKCFIHFILGFLVDGSVPLLKVLLDKRRVVSCIFEGLKYDSYDTVQLVLVTLKKYILEAPGITKTIKLSVFSTPAVQDIVSLYNWKGPKNWKPGKKENSASLLINPEEKAAVVEVVHDFLITLLTSYRYGIVFQDRTIGTSGNKHNQLAGTILASLDRPWEHEKPTDLVIKILRACPDLLKPQWTYVEPFLEPRVSKKWVDVIVFIKKIITQSINLDPKSIEGFKPCFSELTVSQLIAAGATTCAPNKILKITVPSLSHESFVVRHQLLTLLNVMLERLNLFLKAVSEACDSQTFTEVKNGLTNYVLKNFPSLDLILNVWDSALKFDIDIETLNQEEIDLLPHQKDHFMAMLDLLQLYRNVCLELLDIASSEYHLGSKLLTNGLKTLDDLENVEEEMLMNLKLKALQLIVVLDPAMLTSSKTFLTEVITFLVPLLGHKSTEIDSNAKATFNILLRNSGMFEGCFDQIDIWVNSFCTLQHPDERAEIARWFATILQKAVKHIDKYLQLISEAEQVAGEQIISSTRIQDIFNALCEMDFPEGKIAGKNLQPSTSIPPLICSGFESVKKDSSIPALHFISYVTVHTLHYQMVPGPLIYLAKKIPEFPINKYLMSWVYDEAVPIHMKKVFDSSSIEYKLSKALLKNCKVNLQDIFQGEHKVSFKNEGNEDVAFNYSLSSYHVKILLKMTLFYLSQFNQRSILTDEQMYNCEILISSLLNVAKDLENREQDLQLLEQCTRDIFSNLNLYQYFSPISTKKDVSGKLVTSIILKICTMLLQVAGKDRIAKYLLTFKDKFIEQLENGVKRSLRGKKVRNSPLALEFIDFLFFNSKNAVFLLKKISLLEKEHLVDEEKNFTVWGNILPKLLDIVSDKSEVSENTDENVLNEDCMKKICQFLVDLKTNAKESLSAWEISFLKYFERFPHHIGLIKSDMFITFLEKDVSPATIKLLSFLVSRNFEFIPLFSKFAMENENFMQQYDTVFCVLSTSLSYQWDKKFLEKLYDLSKHEIVKYLVDPKSTKTWIIENKDAVTYLINCTFDSEICNTTCETILKSGDKLESVDTNYIEFLEVIFNKNVSKGDENFQFLLNLTHLLIHITVSCLKKDSKNVEKLNVLCEKLQTTIATIKGKNNKFVFENLTKNNFWPQFTRFTLKSGLKVSKDGKFNVPLLKTLSTICDVVYKDGNNDDYVKTLFEMTTSHSEFINTILSSSSVKRDLVELLWILIRKNKATMAMSHVPLYLAAYNATLNENDQFILMILRHYENSGIKLNKYQPYLWGHAAATFYSVKGGIETVLWRQPSTSQVLELLSEDTIHKTIQHFPVTRDLKENTLHPAANVYDPAFYLPLFCHLLEENKVVSCHKITQSGIFALILAACGSTRTDIRLAAYTAISRFYFHLEGTGSKEKLLWTRFIDALKYGVATLETPLETVRLNCITSTFLARASIIMTQPLDPLYLPLHNFIMAKLALDLNTIPELLTLLHSSEVDYLKHRHWILEVIRDGMKTELEMKTALKRVLFKLLLNFYASVLSDMKTKQLILEVIKATVKIPQAARLLVHEYALLPWLGEAPKKANGEEFLNLIIDIVRNVFETLLEKKKIHQQEVQAMLFKILINVKEFLTKDISLDCYTNYVHTLRKVMRAKQLCEAFSKEDMKRLIDISVKFIGKSNEFQDILQYGCKFTFSPKTDSECTKIGDERREKLRNDLKLLISSWMQLLSN